MASEGTLNPKFIKFCVYIFIAEILLLVFFSNPSSVSRVIAAEGVKIENAMGSKTLKELDRKTSITFNDLFIQSGVYAGAWHSVIPTEDEKKASGTMKDMGRGIFNYVDSRMTTCMFLFFLLISRIELLILWLPSSAIIFISSIISGYYLRKMKQGSFAFASPSAHRFALKIILVLITFMPMFLLAPVALTPYFYPVLNIFVAFLMQAIIANIAKRI